MPRFKQLFASGFGYIAYLMAQIYYLVRLLPPGHAYLNPQNIGRFGIHHVIAEAANSLIISKKNIDQVIVFVLMLTGIVLLALQIVALLFSLLFGHAMAASIFITAKPNFDIAFMLLDQVFGVGDGTNNFFNSCVAQNISCDPTGVMPPPGPFPWPFHLALRNMFRFYSLGILLIGTLIFLYFVVVVVVETATTGSPFGQRFQNIWAPIRLVMAVGLLVPLAFGYNSGQYITFAAAKYGSGLATNAWIVFNTNVNSAMGGTGNPTGEDENLIAFPKPPDAAPISEAMSLVHSCAFAYYYYNEHIKRNSGAISAPDIQVDYPEAPGAIKKYLNNTYAIKPYFIKNPTTWQASGPGLAPNAYYEVLPGTTYQQGYEFYSGADIIIRFGRRGGYDMDGDGTTTQEEQDFAKDYPGQVEPTCGDVRIPVTDKRKINASGNHVPASGPSLGYLGSAAAQQMFFELIRDMWHSSAGAWTTGGVGLNEDYIDFAGRMVLLKQNTSNDPLDSPCQMGCNGTNTRLPSCSAAPGSPPPPQAWPDGTAPTWPAGTKACAVVAPAALWKQGVINDLQVEINNQIQTIWNQYNTASSEMDMDPTLLDRGWGGAGIWFNKLAQVNGGFIEALLNAPKLDRMPLIMEDVSEQKNEKDKDPSGIEQFNPNASVAGGEVNLSADKHGNNAKPIAIALYSVFEYWNRDNKNMAKAEKAVTAGAVETGMNLVFGTHGLFAMTNENANIHPLSQLVALGKGLVESAVRNVAASTITAAMGGIAKAIDTQAGPLLGAASGFLNSTAFVGLTAGFVLFYVLPFLPFVYFYFAVASWVKTIFEAMVGVPLWALAHLRLDGDGLPGDSAANGYFLIFEIFIRPVLSVAGLIAALVIFSAQVRVLNFIWLLVTENVGGHDSNNTLGIVGNLNFKRSIIDEFFYTVIYAMIVYMLATSSFKLIDKIPDNILRWMGQGVSSFGDINQDPTEGLTKYAALGGMTAGRQVAGGLSDLAGGLGGSLGKELGRTGGTIRSDIRLKENIEPLGMENGIPVYAFNYIGNPVRYKGVMAQDILKINPDAVVEKDGYLAVYYDRIGIEMEVLSPSKRKEEYDA